jgi:hypothetical protein
MSLLYRYLLIFLACLGLLAGIQVPSLLDQYEKRLDAHLQEVQADLKGYQEIADRDFGGSMESLIRRHRESTDMVFRDEAEPIEKMYLRLLHFQDQQHGLQAALPGKVWYLLRYGDHELLHETWDRYSYNIPLDGIAIYSGFATAALAVLSVELVAGLAVLLTGGRRRRGGSF